MRVFILCMLLSIHLSCSSNNIAEPYTELTTEEKAKKALDDQDFTAAIELYESLISADETAYGYYRFLAAAYAGAGGFEVLSAIKQTLNNASQGSGGSIVDLTASLLPANPTDKQIEMIGKARDQMLALPAAYRDSENADIEDPVSAATQLSLYSTASAMIIINKYTYTPTDGSQAPDINDMTDAEVDQFFANLQAAASQSDGSVSSSIEETINAIDSKPGASRREKLIAYMEG